MNPTKPENENQITRDLMSTINQFSDVNSEEQYSMDIRPERPVWQYKAKNLLSNFQLKMEAMPYWKNFYSVLAFMSSILLIGVITFIAVNINVGGKELSKLPLLYSQASRSWVAMDKELFIFIPVFLGIILIIITRLNLSVFSFDRRLALMLNIATIIFNCLGIVALGQVLTLVLIY